MSSFLGVGIHENCVITNKTTYDEKGSLVIGFSTKVKKDIFAAFAEGTDLDAAEATPKIFPPMMKTFDGNAKTAAEIGQDLKNLTSMFSDILAVYMTTDKVKEAFSVQNLFGPMGINAANSATLETRLCDESFVKGIYKIACDIFIRNITPHFDSEQTFRVKFRRKSKASHFAIIPPKSSIPEVWIESSAVPKEASKVAFSKWELENGYDSGAKATAAAPTEEAQAQVAATFAAPQQPAAQSTAPAQQPAMPQQSTQPTMPQQPVQPTQPVAPVQQQPTQPVQPVQPSAPVQPVQPVQQIQQPANPVVDAQPVAASDPAVNAFNQQPPQQQ